MCDLNWCCVCDKAIHCESNSLYCSQECFTKDATNKSTENQKHQYFLYPRSFKITKKCNEDLPPVPELSPTFSCASDISSPTFSMNTNDVVALFDSEEDVPNLSLGNSACIYCEKQEQHPQRRNFIIQSTNI